MNHAGARLASVGTGMDSEATGRMIRRWADHSIL